MDIGSGILGGSTILGTVAVVFKIFTSKKNESGKLCAEHSGLLAGIKSIKESQDRHEQWLCDIGHDIKKLLTRSYSRVEDE